MSKARLSVVVDTSFLLSYYLTDCHSESAKKVLRDTRVPLMVSALAHAEFVNGGQLRLFWEDVNEVVLGKAMRCYGLDSECGLLLVETMLSVGVWRRSRAISLAHTARLGLRSLDVLHVAYALENGAREFWSFDKRQRALAEVVGLQVNMVS